MTNVVLPAPTEPLVDPETGKIKEIWYRFLSGATLNLNRAPVRYLQRSFTYSDVNQTFGTLPANCLALQTYVQVTSTFANADLIIGTTASSVAVATTYDINSRTTGLYVVDRYMGTQSTVDVPLIIQVNSTAASAGSADIWQSYIEQ